MGEDALYIMLQKARKSKLDIKILGSNMVIKGERVFPTEDSHYEPVIGREDSRFDVFQRGENDPPHSNTYILPYLTRGKHNGKKVCLLGYMGKCARKSE